MNHFVYTLDIATPRPFSTDELRMAIDKLLAEWPVEFEDWKTTYYNEERPI